jgi:outer membrane protein assembly factor BamA
MPGDFMRLFIFCCLLVQSVCCICTSAANEHGSPADTILTIIIAGNRITKTDVVRHLSGVKTGDVVDSSMIARVKKRLTQTGLFSKVDVLLHPSPDGCRLYIMLTEKFYFLPYDLGGEIYRYRYGKDQFWWRFRMGMENSNFRGKAEVLRTNFSFWDWRSLGLGWTKPLFPSPYYCSISGSADVLPDEIFKIDHTILRGSAGTGRKLPANSRIDLTLMPMYRRRDSTTTRTDTTIHVYEAFTMLRFRSDHRDRFFDPTDGWMLSLDVRTNSLYTRVAPQYYQLSGDFRCYLPGVIKRHKLALRATTILRDADAGITHLLLLGGEGSVRGYYRNQFGLRFVTNNSITLSVEYRFPIYQLPEISLYPLDRISPLFSSISYRIDGACIIDYGRVSARINDLFSPYAERMEQGTGFGFGLRVMIPQLEHSACYDLVWGTNPREKGGYLRFMEKPAWHLYLDMFF